MKIAVLGGGNSPERKVSLKSARAVAAALRRKGNCVIMLDPSARSFVRKILAWKPDCVFLALHGGQGEGGIIQGFLETLGLPYTGSGVLTSSLCLNKIMAKKILLYHGLPTPAFVSLQEGKIPAKINFNFPVVVKPSSLGSTIGISIVQKPQHLPAAVKKALSYDCQVFLEQFISGVEIAISILGNNPPDALPIIQIKTQKGFYDYQAKYTPGASLHQIPPQLPENVQKKAAEVAIQAYHLLGCCDLARIDLIVDSKGKPWVLDINTIPGFTQTSLFPDAARAAGINFDDLCQKLVDLCLERYAQQK